jgi:hypothetical protein
MSLSANHIPSRSLGEEKLIEQSIDWKVVLHSSLGIAPLEINAQRAFAKLTQNVRELGPETEWMFIREENILYEDESIIGVLQNWLLAMINHQDWPCPEKIIMMSYLNGKERTWKMVIRKTDGKLPLIVPPVSLLISAFQDEHTHGWILKASNSYTVNRTGEA